MYQRRIICTNSADNRAVVFNQIYGGYVIDTLDGMYGVEVKVDTTDYALLDGAEFNSDTVQARNIVITGRIMGSYQDKREELYAVFRPHTKGTLTYLEGVKSRRIEYYTEKINIPDTRDKIKSFTLSLLCPDPYFSELERRTATLATWLPGFEFVHEFTSAGEEFGVKNTSLLCEIYNDTGVAGTGLFVSISAEGGKVSQPWVLNSTTGQKLSLSVELNGAEETEAHTVQKILIDTAGGKKAIYGTYKTHPDAIDGTVWTINGTIKAGSDFPQLTVGKNVLTYGADAGAEYMTVKMYYSLQYLGV